MVSIQTLGLPALIIKGNIVGNRTEFDEFFDPSSSYTEGQLRALSMRLKRLLSLDHFEYDISYELDGGDSALLSMKLTENGRKVFATILKKGKFTESVTSAILKSKEGLNDISAKEFYYRVEENREIGLSSDSGEELTYGQAVEFLSKIQINQDNIDRIKRITRLLSTQKLQVEYPLFENLITFLDNIPEDFSSEEILDDLLIIADEYASHNILDKSFELYLLIADLAKSNERLPLMISSKMKAAKLCRDMNHDYNAILTILEEIDDGSLEVATQDEREQYYSMLGYCFDKMGEFQMAADLHEMAVMISESETLPSIYIAESHAYLGRLHGENYQPEIATREYLTASTIANAKNDRHLGTVYSHRASLYEVQWARFLSSTAIVMNMNSDRQNAEFYAWQSLKRIVNAISHSDRNKRKTDLFDNLREIVDMNRKVLPDTSEYAMTTLKELDKQLNFFIDGALPLDQEKELLNFINSKISAMLPLPPPVILLIANDGRLILGGEIGTVRWDESILTNDELFSGALSAIMAILSEVISGDEPLRMLDAGQTQIMIEKSDVCIGALLVDRDLNVLRKALRDTVQMMEENYPGLKNWDGYSIDFSATKPRIEEIFEVAIESIQK